MQHMLFLARCSTFYLSDSVQQSVGVLIVLNFGFSLIEAQCPTLTEGVFYDIDHVSEYLFTAVFVIELGFNILSFWCACPLHSLTALPRA